VRLRTDQYRHVPPGQGPATSVALLKMVHRHIFLWFDPSHDAVVTKRFMYLNVLEPHFLQH
jgi:hypothetical protein